MKTKDSQHKIGVFGRGPAYSSVLTLSFLLAHWTLNIQIKQFA